MSTFNYQGNYKCECGKEYSNSQSFNAHKSNCAIHLFSVGKVSSLEEGNNLIKNRKVQSGKVSGKKAHQYVTDKKKQELLIWISEEHTCEKCGKVMTEKYGSGRFCSRSCANARIISVESNLKRRETYFSKHEKIVKIKNCPICGQPNCTDPFCITGNKLQQIKTLIKYFNFNENVLGTKEVKREWFNIRNTLYNLYWKDKKSSSDIAQIYNYPGGSNFTFCILKYLDIPSKSISEASFENVLSGKIGTVDFKNKYKSCWYRTWDNKNVFLRSSYEKDFAMDLDSKHINYDVECLRIVYFDSCENKFRIAIPDFYIIDTNEIVEIKSYYTLDKQNMIDKATKYIELGYNFSLILDHKKLNFVDLLALKLN